MNNDKRKELKAVQALVEEWLKEAKILRNIGAGSEALLMERMVSEFDGAMTIHFERVLSLSEAAEESGYSKAHLGRLVRQSVIPNAGKRGAPSIFRCDLPIKAGRYQSLFFQELLTSKMQTVLSVADSVIGGSDG